ncbi:MAG: phosphatase PAP2 family protein, partial [Acidobacteriota bacterium]|nr:phosphatase PAP2 family protein [Acidobacteriota bacterium]
VAFARVYVGVHYPGDVAAGLGVGAAVAALGWLLMRNWLSNIASSLAQTRALRPLIMAGPR